jgi:hypothetical protein
MTSKPRRRFFQYSLGTLLVFVAFICVLLAVRTNRQHNRRVAIAKIYGLGGQIAFASDWHPVNSFFLNMSNGPVLPKSSRFARLWGDDPSTCVLARPRRSCPTLPVLFRT